MRVLITGGAGRLGLKACKAFLRNGFQVRMLDLETSGNRKRIQQLRGKMEVRWGDITRAESVGPALEGAEAVVHLAGILPPVADQNPELARRVNIGGTRVLVDLLKRKGGRLPFV
jgi:UDP-glucose 4-epimerase